MSNNKQAKWFYLSSVLCDQPQTFADNLFSIVTLIKLIKNKLHKEKM